MLSYLPLSWGNWGSLSGETSKQDRLTIIKNKIDIVNVKL